ncbi:MAG: tetratricopeptide repeat protein [Candidatus Muiribacteriota bacterium]
MKKIYLLFLMIILLTLVMGCRGRENKEFEVAKKYFRAGDYTQAEKILKKVDGEKKPEKYFFLAVALEKNSKYEEAMEIYQKILSKDFESEFSGEEDFMKNIEQEYYSLVLNYAHEEGVKGRFDRAQELINKITGDPSQIHFHMGRIAYARQEYRKAKGHFESALMGRGSEGDLEDLEFSITVRFYKAKLLKDYYDATREKEDLLECFREIRLASNFVLDQNISEYTKRRVLDFYEEIKEMPAYKSLYEEIDKNYERVRIYERGEDWENVIKFALKIFEETKLMDDKFYAAVKIGDAYYHLEDAENAFKYYRKALDIGEGIRDLVLVDLEEKVRNNLEELGMDLAVN